MEGVEGKMLTGAGGRADQGVAFSLEEKQILQQAAEPGREGLETGASVGGRGEAESCSAPFPLHSCRQGA